MNTKLELFIKNNKKTYELIEKIIKDSIPLFNNKHYYCKTGEDALNRNYLHITKINNEKYKNNLLGNFDLKVFSNYNYENFNHCLISYKYKNISINYYVYYEEDYYEISFSEVEIESFNLNYLYVHGLKEKECFLNFLQKDSKEKIFSLYFTTTLELSIGRRSTCNSYDWNNYLNIYLVNNGHKLPTFMFSLEHYCDEYYEFIENYIFNSKSIPTEISNSILLKYDSLPINELENNIFTIDVNLLKIN